VKQGAQPSDAVKKLIKRGKSEITGQPAAPRQVRFRPPAAAPRASRATKANWW
jgi:hypothetical protein